VKFWILSVLVAASFIQSACAFNGDDSRNSDEARVYKENREDLLQKFSALTGIYEGEISTNKAVSNKPGSYKPSSIPAQLAFYTEDVPTGKDSNGEFKILPVLKLRYRQLNSALQDYVLDARFLPASGEITAASSDGGISIRGFLNADSITGDIFRSQGKLGNFKVSLTTRDVQSGLSNSSSDYYSRVTEYYKHLLGRYEGTITPAKNAAYQGPKKDGSPYPAAVEIAIVPAVVDGASSFKLQATLFRNSLDWADGPRRLDVAYDAEFEPALLIMSADGSTSTVPHAYLLEIQGTLENGVYTASVANRLGPMGTLRVQKVP
jgi:hypothetical protein